jgi:hypothetical protein
MYPAHCCFFTFLLLFRAACIHVIFIWLSRSGDNGESVQPSTAVFAAMLYGLIFCSRGEQTF